MFGQRILENFGGRSSEGRWHKGCFTCATSSEHLEPVAEVRRRLLLRQGPGAFWQFFWGGRVEGARPGPGRQVDGIYVINGFYMNMRSKFTAPGTSIYYYEARTRGLEGGRLWSQVGSVSNAQFLVVPLQLYNRSFPGGVAGGEDVLGGLPRPSGHESFAGAPHANLKFRTTVRPSTVSWDFGGRRQAAWPHRPGHGPCRLPPQPDLQGAAVSGLSGIPEGVRRLHFSHAV